MVKHCTAKPIDLAGVVMAAASFSPVSGDSKHTASALQLSSRLKCCWKFDFDWTLIPEELKQVQ